MSYPSSPPQMQRLPPPQVVVKPPAVSDKNISVAGITLEQFTSAWKQYSKLSSDQQNIYNNADLIYAFMNKKPSVANLITEIKFSAPISLDTLDDFPNLRKASAVDVILKNTSPFLPEEFELLELPYKSIDQVIPWLNITGAYFQVIFANGEGDPVIGINYEWRSYTLTSYQGIEDAWNILAAKYNIPYIANLEDIRQSSWQIGEGQLTSLTVILPEKEPKLFTDLIIYQKNTGLKRILIENLYREDELEQELPQYARDLTLLPMLYDFFPADISTQERSDFLSWSCLPTIERIRVPFPNSLRKALLGPWEHRNNLIVASEEDPNIFSLAFKYGPEACYRSGLVKTRMSTLVPDKRSIRIGDGELLSEELLSELKLLSKEHTNEEITGDMYIPVIRYASGPSGGLFFTGEQQDQKYCGTFYYYEPDSETLLHSNKLIASRNKYVLALTFRQLLQHEDPALFNALGNAITKFRKTIETRRLEDSSETRKHYTDELLDLLAGRLDYSSILGIDRHFEEIEGYNNFFYALEDVFDQPLCSAGKRLGYDVLILLEMSGRSRLVTEVLDTRSRGESLENLYSLE